MTAIQFIDLRTQYKALEHNIIANINAVLEHGQFIMGPEVAHLEEKLAAYTGAKYCIAVASGTDALLISLLALGIEPGDEIITTPFTFAATAEVIALLGGKPIFVDIDPSTCNINHTLIEASITKYTKAILPVSLYGQPSNMDEINSIALKYGGIPVIEDAAQSFGATYRDRKSCNLSMIGCTSFFPSKPLGCYGDGGAIFTSDDAIAEACRAIRVHGQRQRYIHDRIGVAGRLDTIQAAVLLAKLNRFDWEVEQRGVIGGRYNKMMDDLGVERIQQELHCKSVFAQYTIFVDGREEIQKNLNSLGIPSSIHYPLPLNEQGAYKQFNQNPTPIASQISKRVLSLPMGPDLSEAQQDKIVKALSL